MFRRESLALWPMLPQDLRVGSRQRSLPDISPIETYITEMSVLSRILNVDALHPVRPFCEDADDPLHVFRFPLIFRIRRNNQFDVVFNILLLSAFVM